MRIVFIVAAFFIMTNAFSQFEISTGVAVNKQDALGFPLHIGYDFKLSEKLYTKTQVGFKYLNRYNEHVGASLTVNTLEFHQTVSYGVIQRKKYILKPNAGVNYRFYRWKGKMQPPYNTLPQRAWVIGVRDGNFVLNSYDNGYEKEYKVNNIGFSFQVQNQFRLTDKVWLHITPFIEPDFDRSQNIGGAYIGVILKPSVKNITR
jgi:hypothetical protein